MPSLQSFDTLLPYSRDNDNSVFLADTVDLHYFCLNLSCCLVAGNPTVEPRKVLENEDALSIIKSNDDLFFGVFDGSANSIVSPYLKTHGVNGARFVSGLLRESLSIAVTERSLKTALSQMNKRVGHEVAALLARLNIHNPPRLPMSTATIAKIIGQEQILAFAHLADCILLVQHTDHTTALLTPDQIEPTFQSVRAALYGLREEQTKISSGSVRSRLPHPLVTEAQEKQHLPCINNPDLKGFGMMNGDPNAELYIIEGQLSLTDVHSILLCSDGFLPDGFEASEITNQAKVFDLITQGGLQSVINWKKQTEEEDREWLKYPRLKHSDDASAIFIDIVR